MLNLKYRKSGNIFIWKPEFYLSIANTTIQDQRAKRRIPTVLGQYPGSTRAAPGQYSGSTRAVLGQHPGSNVSLQDQVWPDQVWPDQVCLYRIICVFTGSYVHVTGSSVTGSSVTGSNVPYIEFDPLHCYSDLQLCHSFVSDCARILFYLYNGFYIICI